MLLKTLYTCCETKFGHQKYSYPIKFSQTKGRRLPPLRFFTFCSIKKVIFNIILDDVLDDIQYFDFKLNRHDVHVNGLCT